MASGVRHRRQRKRRIVREGDFGEALLASAEEEAEAEDADAIVVLLRLSSLKRIVDGARPVARRAERCR